MGIAAPLLAALAAALVVGPTQAPTALIRPLAEAEVNWSAGTVTASAGAAADTRMPGPQTARPGAERRARAAAADKLRAALRRLPVRKGVVLTEKEIATALAKASPGRIEYQSNGGVVLWLQVSFAEESEDPSPSPSPLLLAAKSMELQARPLALVGGKETVLPRVVYQQGQAPAAALPVQVDDQGRIVLGKGPALTSEQLAARPVVIYLQRVP